MQSLVFPRNKSLGVNVLLVLQALGMIGFSMVFALLVLYCTSKLGMSDKTAYAINAAFNALVFAASVPGGYLAEKFLGFRYATSVSILISALGLFLMAIPSAGFLYVGLSFFIIGQGMVVPCLFVLLGRLYEKGDPNREKGFMLSYIGMNLGSFIASSISGSLTDSIGYHGTFFLSGIVTLLTWPIFVVFQQQFKLTSSAETVVTPKISKSSRNYGLLITAFTVAVTVCFMCFSAVGDALLVFLGIVAFAYMFYLAWQLPEMQRKKMLVFIALNIIGIAFWALYSLSPSALTLFMDRNVNRHFLQWMIPTANLQGLNPFFIITIGPLMKYVWSYFSRNNQEISTSLKFALGVIFMGIGYLVLVSGIYCHQVNGDVNLSWIVLSYFFQTIGELMVGPIGYAMVGELVPPQLEGLMMGMWQLSTGVAGALSDYLAKLTVTPSGSLSPLLTNAAYSHAFTWFGLSTVLVGAFSLLFVPKLNQISIGESVLVES